jgi:hypothetical protein
MHEVIASLQALADRVNAQLETSKPVPQMVNTNQ